MKKHKTVFYINYGDECRICGQIDNGMRIYDPVNPDTIYGCASDTFICINCMETKLRELKKNL